MLTTTASRLSTRVPLAGMSVCGRVIAPTTAALVAYRLQQSRAFRFGRIWPYDTEYESLREILRRNRRLRHKQLEALNRRLSWEDDPFASGRKRALKSTIRGCWQEESRPAGRCGKDRTGNQRTPDNPTGVRPGRNIEDVERGPMEHLLFGDKGGGEWWSPFQSIRDFIGVEDSASPTSSARSRSSADAATPSTKDEGKEPEYIIDPITNRKVPRVRSDTSHPPPGFEADRPLATSGSHRTVSSIAEGQTPIFCDGTPPEKELKSNNQVTFDSELWDSAGVKAAPVLESEEYEKNHGTSCNDAVFWESNEGVADGKTPSSWTWNPSYFSPSEEQAGKDDQHIHPAAREPYDDLWKYEVNIPEQEERLGMSQQEHLELGRSGAFKYQELDGIPATQQEVSTSELREYELLHNEVECEIANHEEQHLGMKELSQYEAFGYTDTDGKPASAMNEGSMYDPAEVEQYQAFRYNEPDGKPSSTGDDGCNPAELQEYRAISSSEQDGHSPAAASEVQAEPGLRELRRYGAVQYNEPNGRLAEEIDVAGQALREFDMEQNASRQLPYIEPTRSEDQDSLRASDVRSAVGRGRLSERTISKEPDLRGQLETSMSRYAASSDAEDLEAVASVNEAKQRRLDVDSDESRVGRQLTGNYVRDFPEEFAQSWTSNFTPEPPTRLASLISSSPLQPALSRTGSLDARQQDESLKQTPLSDDLPYKGAQGTGADLPKKSVDNEIHGESGAAVKVDMASLSRRTAAAEPTVYKILAYDPTMQAIDVAETTSDVATTETPLTPAEVLIRLSNPAKFFPHFRPLQAQGFEIVSGSGDVLVFRKIRPATTVVGQTDTAAVAQEPEAATSKPVVVEEGPQPHLVNPIDMTGSRRSYPEPAIGRFASPTGFVNYDLPSMSDAEPVRQFISGIDVRREEPVFSGGSRARDGDGKRKTSLGKRMAVGAVWLAGLSYALGVMGEYFRTGGTDGMGPSGL